jgi:hypothetical protein
MLSPPVAGCNFRPGPKGAGLFFARVCQRLDLVLLNFYNIPGGIYFENIWGWGVIFEYLGRVWVELGLSLTKIGGAVVD